MSTQGSRAFGTQLYRDGVPVAELVALHDIGAREALTLDLTSHSSAARFGEVIQGLRTRRPLKILGNHLPEQTGTWVDDFGDGDTLHVYAVEFPTGQVVAFRGFVVGVGTKGEIGGRLYFDATVVPTAAVEYWHCTSAPAEPGTPPHRDPDHWEVATEAAAVASLEGRFGYDQEAVSHVEATSDLQGTVFPFPTGAPVATVSASGSWPDWPDPATLNIDEADPLCCIYAEVGADNAASAIVAFVSYDVGGEGPATDSMRAGIYNATTGALVATTGAEELTDGAPPAWVEFAFAEPPTLTPGENYALVVWSQNPAGTDSSLWGTGSLEDWQEPVPGPVPDDVPEWDPDGEYVFCNYVHVS